MCNKCESQAVELEPSEVTLQLPTPLQTKWASIKADYSEPDTRKYVASLYVRQVSLRPSEAEQKLWHDSDNNLKTNSRYPARKRDRLVNGQRNAIYKNQANALATKDITDKDVVQPLYQYMYHLTMISYDVACKLEPAYQRVRESQRSGWEMLYISRLHPYQAENAPSGTYETYRTLQDGVSHFEYLHCLHISTEDINQIAYYPTLKHYREGREVRTRLGRYLTKYQQTFGLTDADIKSMAEKHASHMQSRGGWKVDFKEHDDVAGWLEVYDSRDVSSCMKGMDAVRVYAHDKSVLRLAHVVAGEKIIARCIVRDDDTKGWLRVYPDPNGHAEGRYLLDQLRVMGYGQHINLDGVLLRYIRESGSYVCPYIDYGNNGDQTVGCVYVDGKDYLRVGDGEYNATNTNGYCEDVNQCTCDECGDDVDADDLTYVDYGGYNLCDSCLNDNYTYAYSGRYQEWCRNEDVIEVNGEWYHCECDLSIHNIYVCDHDGEYYNVDDMVSTQDGMFHRDYVALVDHEDCMGSNYVYQDLVHTLTDGTTCHEADSHQLQLELDTAEEEIHLAVA